MHDRSFSETWKYYDNGTKLHSTDGCQNILQLGVSEGNPRQVMFMGSKLQAASEYKGFSQYKQLQLNYLISQLYAMFFINQLK